MTGTGWHKVRLRLGGIVFLAVMAASVLLSVKVYDKDFVTSVPVTLKTDRVGNQLHVTSEVKARGVVVGEVRHIRATPSGAEVDLALDPDKIARLPENVSALLVPKTLFGERYVQLSIPDHDTAPPIAPGDVIPQDRSKNAIELERVFDDLLPVLKAVQPQKLATTLTAVATALHGRGAEIGDTIVTAADYLRRFNPNLPKLDENIRKLAEVSRLYGDIAPDLLDSLTDAAVTLGTVAQKRTELSALYDRVTTSSQDVDTFLSDNKENLIRLAATSRAPLQLTARYSPSFPCTLKALTDLEPSMDKVLGAGTTEPGLHADIITVPKAPGYQPGADDPVYNATGGPRCYPSGVPPVNGIPAAAPGTTAQPLTSGDLGLANSPQEQELIANLVAPSLNVAPGQVPAWSSVLVGPLYRGKEVAVP
jgi:phospholipid/cholesterol/gamma-HCH transport system substrate-binding protein